MTKIFVSRVRTITKLILVSSIFSLTLISVLPIFSEDINGELFYYDLEGIKNSVDIDIQVLYDSLNLMVICNWILILFSILAFIGLMLIISNKYLNIAKIIMLIVCANIIFSALSVLLSWMLIKNTGNINDARMPFIISSIAVNYQYFPLISSSISLVGSVLYLIFVPNFYFKCFMGLRKQKKIEEKAEKKNISTKSYKKEEKVNVKQSVSQKFTPITEQSVGSNVKDSYEGYIQEDHADSEQYPAPERRVQMKTESMPEKEPVDAKEPYETNPFQQDIESDIPKEKHSERKEQQSSPIFEQALSSAIEKKRQFGTNKVDEPPKQPPLKKRLTIRCPECKNIFTVEKEEGVLETKIECPKCGRKGVIKQQ